MKIIHLSDLHAERKQIDALVGHILAREDLAACAVAITGDITDDSQPHEWRDIQQALAPLVGLVAIWLVPGNHDTGMRGITYDEERAARARTACDMISTTPITASPTGLRVWRWGPHRIIGLDSQRGQKGELLPPLARGEIGAEQLAALEVELADPAPTIILLHHHPLWSEWTHALEDSEQLLALLDRRPQVKAVLYGHRHREESATRGKHGARKTLYIGAGKSTEDRAYRVLDLETLRLTRAAL